MDEHFGRIQDDSKLFFGRKIRLRDCLYLFGKEANILLMVDMKCKILENKIAILKERFGSKIESFSCFITSYLDIFLQPVNEDSFDESPKTSLVVFLGGKFVVEFVVDDGQQLVVMFNSHYCIFNGV